MPRVTGHAGGTSYGTKEGHPRGAGQTSHEGT